MSRERESFLSPWALLLLLAGLILLLVGFQPAKRFLDMGEPETAGDKHAALLVAEAHVKANPDNRDMRLELARLQLELQNPEAAGRTLAPLAGTDDTEVQWWLLEQKWQAMNARAEAGDARSVGRQDFVEQLDKIHQASDIGGQSADVPAWSLSRERLETLAARWLAVGHPGRAAECFEALAERDDARQQYWLDQAGRSWLQAGAPGRAAAAWHRAWQAGDDGSDDVTTRMSRWLVAAAHAAEHERRELARQSLRAAIQDEPGSAGNRSLAYAREYLARYQDDPVLLDLGIRIALANDALEQALAWSERLLAIDGRNPQNLERFSAIALAMGRPDMAVDSLAALSRLQPGNVRYLEQLANVQRWSGNSAQALASLEKLALQTGDVAVDRRVVKLARLSYDRRAALDALRRIEAQGQLNAAERGQLIDVLNELGKPDEAIARLRRWQAGGGLSLPLKVRLATLLEWVGELEASGRVWAALASAPGGDAVDARYQKSRLLRRQWRLDEAMAALPEDEPEALARRGELGWATGQADAVLAAYRALARRQPLSEIQIERLFQAARADGDIALIARMAEHQWREDGDRDALLLALQAAEDLGRPDIARRLLTLAQQEPERFVDSPVYWGLVGTTRLQQASPATALTAYRRGLAVAPDNVSLRSGELYAMAQLGMDGLRQRLAQARGLAAHSQSLSLAMASGWQSLGEVDRASRLFRRALTGPRPLPEVMISSAEGFAQAGMEGVARQLRRHVLRTEASALARQLEPDHDLTEGELVAQLEALVWALDEAGRRTSAGWYQRLTSETPALAAEPVQPGVQLLSVLANMDQPERYRYLMHHREAAGLPTPDFHALNLAIRRNDRDAMARLLDESPDEAFSPTDRLTALQQLGRYGDARKLAKRLQAAGADTRSDLAALDQRLPNRVAISARFSELGDLSVEERKATYSRTPGVWGSRWELGERRLDGDDLDLPVVDEGIERERFVTVGTTYHGRRSTTRAEVGAVESDAASYPRAGLSHEHELTSRVIVNAALDWQQPATGNDYLRLFATEDSLRLGFAWEPTQRDRFTLAADQRRFRDRFDGDAIGDSQRLESAWEHALIQGATRRLGLSLLASHDEQQADRRMPRALRLRFPAGTTPEALTSDDVTFVGAGISVSRGNPEQAYPQVASPRWRIELGGGHQWPSGDFAGSASVAVGSRVFGGDELSFDASIDQGAGAESTTRVSAGIQYQLFLDP